MSTSSFNSKLIGIGALAGVAAASAGLTYYFTKRTAVNNKSTKANCCGTNSNNSSKYNPNSQLLTLDNDGQIKEFIRIYERLTSEFLAEIQSQYSLSEIAIHRLQRMFDYNIKGGKYNRACLVTNTVQKLCKWKSIAIEQYWDQSLVLGWCIEILQDLFLVADDIMDHSITRRGQPCWYLVSDIGNDAINDTLILESFLFYLLTKYFNTHNNYSKLVELYQSVSLQTQLGQMLDLMSVPQGRRTAGTELLNKFSLDMYNQIVCYKTAIYSFYLPIAAGIILLELDTPSLLTSIRSISIGLGTKFQIEDDYLDCYGLPEHIGKIGTDIKDHKCSWLIVQALLICNPAQRAIIEQHYGKDSNESESKIKSLYNELNLTAIYNQQEDSSYSLLSTEIDQCGSILPIDIYMPILKKIHKRTK